MLLFLKVWFQREILWCVNSITYLSIAQFYIVFLCLSIHMKALNNFHLITYFHHFNKNYCPSKNMCHYTWCTYLSVTCLYHLIIWMRDITMAVLIDLPHLFKKNKQTYSKVDKRIEQTFLQRRYSLGQWANEKMLNITNH